MIQYKLKYKDNGSEQFLEIIVINEHSFLDDSYEPMNEDAKEIYLLLISDKHDEIQEYLNEMLTNEKGI